jgi:hypothetical protein
MASGRSGEQLEAGDHLEVVAVERHEWNAGGDAASGNPGVVRSDRAAYGLTVGGEPPPDP